MANWVTLPRADPTPVAIEIPAGTLPSVHFASRVVPMRVCPASGSCRSRAALRELSPSTRHRVRWPTVPHPRSAAMDHAGRPVGLAARSAKREDWPERRASGATSRAPGCQTRGDPLRDRVCVVSLRAGSSAAAQSYAKSTAGTDLTHRYDIKASVSVLSRTGMAPALSQASTDRRWRAQENDRWEGRLAR